MRIQAFSRKSCLLSGQLRLRRKYPTGYVRQSVSDRHRYGNCIPTALVTVGSNVSSLGRLLARLNDRLTIAGEGGVVALESGDAPNLKTTLKNIIRAAITNTEGNEGYQSFLTDRDVCSSFVGTENTVC